MIEPRFKEMPLRCAKCAHEWTDYIAVECRFEVAIASMKAITRAGCPNCGAKRYKKRGTVMIVTGTAKAENWDEKTP